MNGHFTKEGIWMANKHVKNARNYESLEKFKVKTTMGFYYYTPIRMANIKDTYSSCL